ncbi:MAG TPA: HAD-IA family hydrolase [Anaerolineales bacterium]|nr:HAD-IA family hydrolase [Anaerolineales bacterium]
MAIKAIVFDIGGVLEITPNLGIDEQWEKKLNLKTGELYERLREVWKGGSLGTISIQQVHEDFGRLMKWDETQVNAYMDDVWREYLGALNVELADYFRSLRPKYKTAIISNSFVGAREKEAEHYQFDTICDFIIYSHEVGLSKPDPRIFALACERLGLQPNEIIFVDDHADVYASAVEMGMHCFEFNDNAQIIAEIEACVQSNLNS